MREQICLILNAKTKKEAFKEMYDTISLFREDCHLDTECRCSSAFNKSELLLDYEEEKQKYRDLPKEEMSHRLLRSDCGTAEDYIDYVMGVYGWGTFMNYVKDRYNIIRFDGEVAIGLHNPEGYIDSVSCIYAIKKYKNITSKVLKSYGISRVVFKDKTYFDTKENVGYRTNRMLINQKLKNNVSNDDYVAVVRVHF